MTLEPTRFVNVIDFWRRVAAEEKLHERFIVEAIDRDTKEVVDIVGPRRSGKSSVLKLLIKRLGLKENFLYINFEDPFFIENDQAHIIEDLIATYKTYFSPALKYLFFDEIQAIDRWERAVRKLRDGGEYKIYITGSSSKLLSGEIASVLTGRHLSYRLMPLSFPEYLAFKGVDVSRRKDIILKKQAILKNFSEYLSEGGFPAVVLTRSAELLKQYFFDILEKDIIARHDIRGKGILEKMAVYLMSNAAKTTSIESLKKTFGISFKLAVSFIDYFKEAFLFFEVPQFSYSLKTQQKALKKLYAVDCGLAGAVSFRFSEDRGRMLENCVFLHLLKNNGEIYYYKTGKNLEVDFFVRTKSEGTSLIQVAWSLGDPKTKDREARALLGAMSELKLKEGMILTFDEEEKILQDGKTIVVKPVFSWFLEDSPAL